MRNYDGIPVLRPGRLGLNVTTNEDYAQIMSRWPFLATGGEIITIAVPVLQRYFTNENRTPCTRSGLGTAMSRYPQNVEHQPNQFIGACTD